jgi:nitrogen fixation/metabolism regulation signal transduction histidine kinase
MKFERRILLLAFAAGFPGTLVAMLLLWGGDYSSRLRWTLTVLIAGLWFAFAYALRDRVVVPLQTIANLLAALREEDFSVRARGEQGEDALGEVMVEVNALGATLRDQRLGALEATALLRKVMEEIDVAVFTFDSEQTLRLVNRAGERLLAQPQERLLGRDAHDLGLAGCLEGEHSRTLAMTFPGGTGRWGIRRSIFREKGMPHQLLVMADLSQPLREEERQAWQRLIRVLGHELNNSLAPIKSMAGTLERLVVREPRPDDWQDDMRRGLNVIASRAEALSRFMNAYARLAKLPPPRYRDVRVSELVNRVAGLEIRLPVRVAEGPDAVIQADGDQLEQLLINLLRNAVDASLETRGGVQVGWGRNGESLDVWVRDEGHGISNPANLFVPFFTTKPAGSGIGLVLCRQIAEAHGGALTLENRKDAIGCEARLRLPL